MENIDFTLLFAKPAAVLALNSIAYSAKSIAGLNQKATVKHVEHLSHRFVFGILGAWGHEFLL